MKDEPATTAAGKSREDLRLAVAGRRQRKLRAQREERRGVWFGLGMFGLVGWSVAVPTVLFTVLGVWLDVEYPTRFSWTLTLLFAGIVVGCLNAWFWIKREGHDDE